MRFTYERKREIEMLIYKIGRQNFSCFILIDKILLSRRHGFAQTVIPIFLHSMTGEGGDVASQVNKSIIEIVIFK